MGKATFTPIAGHWRFYEDGTENGSTPIAAEDTDIIRDADSSDVNLHLRVIIAESGGASGATTDDWQLQYSLNSGTYTNITSSSSVVKGFNSASLTDGGVTTNRATNGLTDPGSGSFVDGEISEDGLIDDRQLTANNFTELLYSLTLVSADLNYGDEVTFRWLINGSTFGVSSTANHPPQITIASGTATYYFDASDSGPTDPGGAWASDSNAVDGDDTTTATTSTNGNETSNYLEAGGTNSPSSGSDVVTVFARINASGGQLGDYVELTAPGGGWSWSVLQALEFRAWKNESFTTGSVYVYEDGTAGGSELGQASISIGPQMTLGVVELLVYLGSADGAGEETTPTRTLLGVGT